MLARTGASKCEEGEEYTSVALFSMSLHLPSGKLIIIHRYDIELHVRSVCASPSSLAAGCASDFPWRARSPAGPFVRAHSLGDIGARAMAPDSSSNFGEQDFVTSHKPWSLQSSNFAKKIQILFGFRTPLKRIICDSFLC